MKIQNTGASIKKISTQRIPPDPANMITALRQIGYTLEQSLADLIDNSINANASKVLIRFIHDNEKIDRVLIVDNGEGMNDRELKEAMKFGSAQKNDGKSLGKYGMGLKVASLGYAKSLTVLTKKKNYTGGRRWTVKGISDGWMCDELDTGEVKKYLKQPLGNVKLSTHGTVLIWSDIDRLTIKKSGVAKTLQSIKKKLGLHFGLCFHRFIEDERLEIRIDDGVIDAEETGICKIVDPINPFGYGKSATPDFPKTYAAEVPGVGRLKLVAHIWPPNSKSIEYKLGGRTAARQGFYFYRNDRLIQPGGWNGIVDNETEPHTSLARVVINMDPNQDAQYGLNVQKSAIIVPTAFEDAVKSAKSSDGDTLQEYRITAQKLYRKDDRHKATYALVPDDGLPKNLIREVKYIITNGKAGVRKVRFEWGSIKSGGMFELDRKDKRIILNSAYRKDILAGNSASKSDVPTFKLLLFLLLEEDLDRTMVSAKQKERLDLINQILTKSVPLNKG